MRTALKIVIALSLLCPVCFAHQVELAPDILRSAEPYVVVRDQARSDASEIGVLTAAQPVELIAFGDDWHLVRLPDSSTGFVASANVMVVPDSVAVTPQDLDAVTARMEKNVARTMSNMRLLLTVLAIVLTFLGLLGLGGAVQHILLGRKTNKTLKDAKTAANKVTKEVNATMQHADEALDHVKKVQQGLSEVWNRADEMAESLPLTQASWTMNIDTPDVDPESAIAWQDFERLLVWADRLKIATQEKTTAAHYLNVAHAWRHRSRFARSAVRAQRSIELDDSNWVAHRALADALSYWAAYDKGFQFLDGDLEKEKNFKMKLLRRALEAAETAKDKWDGEDPTCPNSLGWIHDTLGKLIGNTEHHQTAVTFFDEADQLAKKLGAQPEIEYDWSFRYNTMCALAGAGGEDNFRRAFEIAKELVENGWDSGTLLKDPDLDPIMSDPKWRELFDSVTSLA